MPALGDDDGGRVGSGVAEDGLGLAGVGIPDSSVPAVVEPLRIGTHLLSASLEFAAAFGGAADVPRGSRDVPDVEGAVGGLGGVPQGDPAGDTMRIAVLKSLSPLRISTWNSQALLGGMFSRVGRVTRKRSELDRLCSDVVFSARGPWDQS